MKRFVAALVVAALGSTSLHAQPTKPSDTEIVIEAQKKRALRSFVEALAQSGPTDQVARWKDEVCPIVAGLPDAEARWVTDRIVEVAKAAELRRAPSNCLPRLIVLVTPNIDTVVAQISSRFPRNDGVWKLSKFEGRPVRWVSLVDECGFEGCSLPNSRLQKATTPTFTAVLILVDATQLSAYKLGELADYVAFVGLTNPSPKSVHASTSIMSMFEGQHLPGQQFALTERDEGFLVGLYHSRPNSSSGAQKDAIEEVMKRRAASGNKARDRDHY